MQGFGGNLRRFVPRKDTSGNFFALFSRDPYVRAKNRFFTNADGVSAFVQ